jgi:hypothetical protein
MSGSKSPVFRIRLKTIAIESIERNKSIIADTENSGTVDVGLGEMEVELVGMVIVCVLLQPLVWPTKNQGERGIAFLYRSMPQSFYEEIEFYSKPLSL